MVELGALLLLGVAVLTFVVAIAAALKAVLWIILLPIRLVFWLLGMLLVLPLLLVKLVFGGIVMLIALPLIVIGLALAFVVAAVAIVLPLVPFILLIALIWYLIKPDPHALART
jgi:hypothetical protein